MKRRIGCILFVLSLAFATSSYALSLLVSEGRFYEYGYGKSSWGEMTSFIDTATGDNVTVVYDFSDLSQMLKYDALWLDIRNPGDSLTSPEVNNLKTFINTGRRVVMIGENNNWPTWDNSILGVVGGTLNLNDGAYGTVTSIYSHPLTNSAPIVYVPTGGAAEGGTALYSKNFATLWGSNSNVLTVLDMNVFQDSFLNRENNRQFAKNVANWVANSGTVVPEPTTILLLGSGLLGLLGLGARKRKNISTCDLVAW